MPKSVTARPLAAKGPRGPSCVPVIVQRHATRSRSSNRSSVVKRRLGKAVRNSVVTRRIPSLPRPLVDGNVFPHPERFEPDRFGEGRREHEAHPHAFVPHGPAQAGDEPSLRRNRLRVAAREDLGGRHGARVRGRTPRATPRVQLVAAHARSEGRPPREGHRAPLNRRAFVGAAPISRRGDIAYGLIRPPLATCVAAGARGPKARAGRRERIPPR